MDAYFERNFTTGAGGSAAKRPTAAETLRMNSQFLERITETIDSREHERHKRHAASPAAWDLATRTLRSARARLALNARSQPEPPQHSAVMVARELDRLCHHLFGGDKGFTKVVDFREALGSDNGRLSLYDYLSRAAAAEEGGAEGVTEREYKFSSVTSCGVCPATACPCCRAAVSATASTLTASHAGSR